MSRGTRWKLPEPCSGAVTRVLLIRLARRSMRDVLSAGMLLRDLGPGAFLAAAHRSTGRLAPVQICLPGERWVFGLNHPGLAGHQAHAAAVAIEGGGHGPKSMFPRADHGPALQAALAMEAAGFVLSIFLKTARLRCNSLTVQLTHIKCAVQRFFWQLGLLSIGERFIAAETNLSIPMSPALKNS